MKKIFFFLLIIIIIIGGCSVKKQNDQKNSVTVQPKKILMVISPVDFRDSEYLDSRKIFEDNKFDVKVASIQKGEAVGADGAKVNVDLVIGAIDPNAFDGVVFIGGPGMLQIIDDDTLQIAVKKFYNLGKMVAAICVAPSILAQAGILKDKNATSYGDVKKDLIEGGAKYQENSVTQDGNIITANGPEATKEFAEKIVNSLK